MDRFISGTTIKKQFDVSTITLNRWADSGKVQVVRGPGGKRLYSQKGIAALFSIEFNPEKEKAERTNICYCRVSSSHQSEDLGRQIKFLESEYPGYEIVSDIGSGLNWKRKGLCSLLERVYNKEIGKVVAAYKDRLCRFGIEPIELIFKKAGTELVVHGKNNDGESLGCKEEKELSDDLIAVVTSFVARANGRRSGINRRRRNEQEKRESINGETEELSIEFEG